MTGTIIQSELSSWESYASRHWKRGILVILCAAFFARMLAAVFLTNIDPGTAQVWEYGDMARYALETGRLVNVVRGPHIPSGAFFYDSAFMPPFYTFMWMGAYAVFGVGKAALAFMTFLNVVMGTAIVYYVMRIARTLFASDLVALTAGVIIAFQPVFVASVSTYHALNLYILLLLAIYDLATRASWWSYRGSILTGALTGLAALVRTEYLVLGGAIHLGVFLFGHREWKKTAIAAFASLLVIAPWTIRNYVVLHHFIPIANSEGYNLYKGFNSAATGSGRNDDNAMIAQDELREKMLALPLDQNYESQRDKLFRDHATTYMAEHPVRSFVVLPVIKTALFWGCNVYEKKVRGVLYQLQFWPLFILSLIGLYGATRGGYFSKPAHRTVLTLFAFQTLVMMAYAVHARYRMNVEPFLTVYASFGLLMTAAWLRPMLAKRLNWFHGG